MRTHGDAVELRFGGGARRVVGGLLLTGAATGWILSSDSMRAHPEWGLVLAALGAIGLYLFWVRSGLRIDPHSRTIGTWWRLGPIERQSPHGLDVFEEVAVRKEIVQRGSRSPAKVHYPVRLVGEETSLRLISFGDPARARRFAEVIARVVWKPLRSDVAGAAVVRAPEQLDLGLADRLAAEGSAPSRPVPPQHSHVAVADRDGVLTIDLPPIGAGRSGLALVVLALPGALAAPVFLFGFAGASPAFFHAIFLSIAVGPLLLGGGLCAVRGRASSRILVAPGRVRIDRTVMGFTRSKEVAADAIEEIVVADPVGGLMGGLLASGGVTLLSDASLHTIGRGLTRDELHFVAELITWSLCDRRGEAARTESHHQLGQGAV